MLQCVIFLYSTKLLYSAHIFWDAHVEHTFYTIDTHVHVWKKKRWIFLNAFWKFSVCCIVSVCAKPLFTYHRFDTLISVSIPKPTTIQQLLTRSVYCFLSFFSLKCNYILFAKSVARIFLLYVCGNVDRCTGIKRWY